MSNEQCLIEFHDRLQHAVSDMSYRKLGRLTDTHPETVRRYMQGQAPSTTFLINLCKAFGISADWLLTGRGAMRCSDIRMNALRLANPSELLNALAASFADQTERLARLEQISMDLDGVRAESNTVREHKPETRPKASRLGLNTSEPVVAKQAEPIAIESHTLADSTDESDCVSRIRTALSKRSA